MYLTAAMDTLKSCKHTRVLIVCVEDGTCKSFHYNITCCTIKLHELLRRNNMRCVWQFIISPSKWICFAYLHSLGGMESRIFHWNVSWICSVSSAFHIGYMSPRVSQRISPTSWYDVDVMLMVMGDRCHVNAMLMWCDGMGYDVGVMCVLWCLPVRIKRREWLI